MKELLWNWSIRVEEHARSTMPSRAAITGRRPIRRSIDEVDRRGDACWSRWRRAVGCSAIASVGQRHRRPSEGPTISLAILPFRNASGDPTLDSLGPSVSQVLGTTLGQSSHVRTVPPTDCIRCCRTSGSLPVRPDSGGAGARGRFHECAPRVVGDSTRDSATQIRIDATLQDLDRGDAGPAERDGAERSQSADQRSHELAEAVRQNLARGSPDILDELKSTAWKPSTDSFEALRLYNEGARFTQQGTHQEALKSFEAATKADGNFALAFSALAQSYATSAMTPRPLRHSRRAMSLTDALPPQEKHRIAANHYRIVNDNDKAIEAYENLVKSSPDDAMIQFELGGLYEQRARSTRRASSSRRSWNAIPSSSRGCWRLGRVEIKQGNPQPSLEHLDKALSLATRARQATKTRAQYPTGDRDRLHAAEPSDRGAEALRRVAGDQATTRQQTRHGRQLRADRRGPEDTSGNPGEAEKSYRAR